MGGGGVGGLSTRKPERDREIKESETEEEEAAAAERRDCIMSQ